MLSWLPASPSGHLHLPPPGRIGSFPLSCSGRGPQGEGRGWTDLLSSPLWASSAWPCLFHLQVSFSLLPTEKRE